MTTNEAYVRLTMSTTRRHIVSGPGLAASPAPISQAVVAGNTCYVSGQLPIDAEGRFRPAPVGDQARLALTNLSAVLSVAGFSCGDLVFAEVVLTDLDDLAVVNAVYAEFFDDERRPARTVFQAAALPYGARVKVHGVAVRAG